MTDVFQPNPPPQFAPLPNPLAAAEPVNEKPTNGRKGRRGPRQPKEAKPEKKPRAYSRKQKASVEPPPRPAAVMVDLEAAIGAMQGLVEEESKFVLGVVQAMKAFSGGQRKRIVTALARMFS